MRSERSSCPVPLCMNVPHVALWGTLIVSRLSFMPEYPRRAQTPATETKVVSPITFFPKFSVILIPSNERDSRFGT